MLSIRYVGNKEIAFYRGKKTNLSIRCINCIQHLGIKGTKKAVKQAILSGKVYYKKGRPDPDAIQNFGKKSFEELCKWADYKEPSPIRCPTCGQIIKSHKRVSNGRT